MVARHRGISTQQIATAIGRTAETVRHLIRGETKYWRHDALMSLMDEVDDAIDQITTLAGGMQALCGCSDSALHDYSDLLREARYA